MVTRRSWWCREVHLCTVLTLSDVLWGGSCLHRHLLWHLKRFSQAIAALWNEVAELILGAALI